MGSFQQSYCTNKNVGEENNHKLTQLPGKEWSFQADDTFKGNYDRQTLDKKMPSERYHIRLKVGAQIMLTRNMPHYNLVNVSQGIVKSFEEESKIGHSCCLVPFFYAL